MRLVVRYHPSERAQFVPAKNVEFSQPSEPIAPLLHAVDLVVVMTSTAGLEAHLVGKPVVSVSGSVYDPDVPFAEFGVSVRAPAIGDLERVLLAELRPRSNPDLVSTIHRQAVRSDATGNVLSVIDSLLSQR